jgi:hypothetical protein
MSVVVIYLAALLIPMVLWGRKKWSPFDSVIFYLGVLGLGLFVYYSGRAHVLNLVTVCWPAVLIVAIATDRLRRAVRGRLLPWRFLWLSVIGLAFLLIPATTLHARMPALAVDAVEQYFNRGVTEESFVKNELALIRRNATRATSCLILSRRLGIYFAESGLTSAVKGPGLV